MGHEHGKVGQVRARARGVRPVGGQQAAVLRGPVAGHGLPGVAPEGAVGVEVLLRLLLKTERSRNSGEHPQEPAPQSGSMETHSSHL